MTYKRNAISLLLLLSAQAFFSACSSANLLKQNSSLQPPSSDIAIATEGISASLSSSQRQLSSDMMCYNVNSIQVKSWDNSDFSDAVRLLSAKELRFPGGEVANYWDWTRGGLKKDINGLPNGLPHFLRPKDLDYTSGTLENFKGLLNSTDTSPLFVLNMLTSDLETQTKMLQTAQSMGIEVRDIELGNEYYFGTGNNKVKFPNPAAYGKTVSQWAKALKKDFPQATISAVAVESRGSQEAESFLSRRKDWNKFVLSQTLSDIDALTLHIYTSHGLAPEITEPTEYPFFNSEDTSTILGEPFRRWNNIQNDNGFKAIPLDKKIWITEYNLFEQVRKNRDRKAKVVGSWAHGLHTLSMSLLMLEDPRIDKICNHVLVGNVLFAAIFADESSFKPFSPEIQSIPNGLSATGSTLKLLGEALDNSTLANRIDFNGAPKLKGKNNFEYPSLLGWKFIDDQKRYRSVIMNLSGDQLKVNLSALLPNKTSYKQTFAAPRQVVTNTDSLTTEVGEMTDMMVLQPYSVTLFKED